MAYSIFPTLTDGQILTGAHTQIIRDNFAETAVGKATTPGAIFVATGSNQLAQRLISATTNDTSGTTTSTTFTATLTGGGTSPAVTVTTGTQALVFFTCQLSNSTAGQAAIMSVAVSGASTVAAADGVSINNDSAAANSSLRMGATHLFTGLTAGSNTFTMQYRVQAGTGTFLRRHLIVMAL